jgi:hypothetical protein
MVKTAQLLVKPH